MKKFKQLSLTDCGGIAEEEVIIYEDTDIYAWCKAFQEYCDSDEIREESALDGLNACGFWYACDYCEGDFEHCACARALIDWCKDKKRKIDYLDTSKEYLDSVLRGDFK